MAIVTKTRTYNNGDVLPPGYYNADRDEIIAGVNSIDNAQVSPVAGILESKITFNGSSGHNHSGGSNGKKIDISGIDLSSVILPESQITFSPAGGHIHDGVVSTKVPVVDLDPTGLTPLEFVRVNSGGTALESAPVTTAVPRTYILTDYKELFVEVDTSPNPYVDTNIQVIQLVGIVQTAPTGADIICTVKILGGATIGTLTIPDGTTSGSLDLSGSPVPVAIGDFLELDVTQIGSSVAGSKLTVSVSAVTV